MECLQMPAERGVWPRTRPDTPLPLQGVCRADDGCVVFVERALPGEVVQARIVQRKKSEAALPFTQA